MKSRLLNVKCQTICSHARGLSCIELDTHPVARATAIAGVIYDRTTSGNHGWERRLVNSILVPARATYNSTCDSGMQASDINFKFKRQFGQSVPLNHISVTFTSRAIGVTIPRGDAIGPAGELTVGLNGCTKVEEWSNDNSGGNEGQELKLGSHSQHSVTISYGW